MNMMFSATEFFTRQHFQTIAASDANMDDRFYTALRAARCALLDQFEAGRERSLALTKLDEAALWYDATMRVALTKNKGLDEEALASIIQ